jgi:CheY-like chemotaxis protein
MTLFTLGIAISVTLLFGLLVYARLAGLFPWQSILDAEKLIDTKQAGTSRGWFWFSFFLLFLVCCWTIVRLHPDYHDFFVISAYLPIDVAYLIVLILTAAVFLYSVRSLLRLGEDSIRDLSSAGSQGLLLRQIQISCSGRIPTAELSRLFLQHVVDKFECDGGAVALHTKGKHPILATHLGLSREEIAAWEEDADAHRWIRNLAHHEDIQRIVGTPGVAGNSTRYDLVAITSGAESCGLLILKRSQKTELDRPSGQILQSVTEWLGERITLSQKEREVLELRESTKGLAVQSRFEQTLVRRIVAASTSVHPLEELTEALCGLFGSTEVLLFQKAGAGIEFISSAVGGEFSTQMTDALLKGLQRTTPIVINQELGEEDLDFVFGANLLWSNLLVPVSREPEATGLLFRSSTGRIQLGDHDRELLSLIVDATRLCTKVAQSRGTDQIRRRILDRVIRLLRESDSLRPFADDPSWMFRRLATALPESTRWIVWRFDGEVFEPAAVSHGIIPASFKLHALQSGSVAEPMFYLSAAPVAKALRQLGGVEAEIDAWMPSENRLLHALMPFRDGVGLVSLPLSSFSLAQEYERMLLLASHLMHLLYRTIGDQRTTAASEHQQSVLPIKTQDMIESQLPAIVAEPEVATSEESLRTPSIRPEKAATIDTLDRITPLLERARISGNLYMVGGRPRELVIDAQGSLPAFEQEKLLSWLDQVLARFSLATAPDDHLVIELRSDEHGHLLLLHRVNRLRPAPLSRPPLDRLRDPRTLAINSSTDAYRRFALSIGALLWIDQSAASPAAVGFYFRSSETQGSGHDAPKHIVAIDDSTIILDLISALGQSLGMQVHRFSTCREARAGIVGLSIDVAFIDLVLPDGSGMELARELTAQRPKLPKVLVCGWERTLSATELQEAGIRRVLRKPFRLEQLSELLSDVLSAQSQPFA